MNLGALAQRLPARVRAVAAKVFPSHWSFLLGELAMFCFLVLVITGIYLSLFYDASGETTVYRGSYEPMVGTEVPRSYASVMDITFDRPAGALVRQVHHWAALVFVAAIVLHAARIFFTGAFRRPRTLNWVIGVTLMGLAMATGFFGVSMPHDLLGGTGSRIGHAFAVSIPVIGPGVADLVFGGEFGAAQMLHRFWLLHVIVLPLTIGVLMIGHLALVWRQSHTQFSGEIEGEPEIDRKSHVIGAAAWPGYALKATGLMAVTAGVLVALGAVVQISPIWLYGPFEAAAATGPAQPDWYLGWVEGWLRIMPAIEVTIFGYEIPSAFFNGVGLPIAVFAILYAWPFLEAWITGDDRVHHLIDRPRDRPVRTALGTAGITALTIMLMAGSHDLQALLLRVPVNSMTTAYRLLIVLAPLAAGLAAYSMCRSLVRDEREGRGGTRRSVAP